MTHEYEILSIGNAIVDILSHVDEGFIAAHALEKGTMRLVDENQSLAMLATLGHTSQASGGSAANTAACIASLGASSAYIGKVAEDELGQAFRESMGQAGVEFSSGDLFDAVSTANCLAVVTPDGERTMSTFLGACRELSTDDISEDLIHASSVIFLEGYLFDSATAADALAHAAHLARRGGREIALTLSDGNCIRRNRAAFKTLLDANLVDVIIANEKEIVALLEDDHPGVTAADAIELCRNFGFTSVVTLGADGAVGISNGEVTRIPAFSVDSIVDLVGAGDSFAAGYLVGHARNLPIEDRLTLGAACAAEVITTSGARPSRPLADLANVRGVIATRTPTAA